jgi:DNA-binding NtrC family response regulator
MSEKLYPSFNVLVVDDEPAWLDSLQLSLERIAGITNVRTCDDSRRVRELLAAGQIGLVLLDLTMPHLSGQDLLKIISENYPEVKVIILTGMNQIETAVECMKLGAYDYFVKTEEEQRLCMGVLNAIHMIELQWEYREMSSRFLDDVLECPDAFSEIITTGKTMRSIFQYIESTAKSTQPFLITGESGVGKDLVARAVHVLSGRNGKLVCVNVAGLDDAMFSDTLFGHTKGAYTGADSMRNGLIEEASQGTLFLDEIGDMTISSQVKLLRVLNDGEYFQIGSDKPKRSKARIVVATNQDLSEKMKAGLFRKDLYYRLQIHKVNVPPLRERKEDIPLLLETFLREADAELGKSKTTVPAELINALETYSFPGNIREFKSMVFDAVSRHKGGVLSMTPFLEAMGIQDQSKNGVRDDALSEENLFADFDTLPSTEQIVELLVDEAMRRAKGNQSLAARLLGLTQSALNKRLKRSGKR